MLTRFFLLKFSLLMHNLFINIGQMYVLSDPYSYPPQKPSPYRNFSFAASSPFKEKLCKNVQLLKRRVFVCASDGILCCHIWYLSDIGGNHGKFSFMQNENVFQVEFFSSSYLENQQLSQHLGSILSSPCLSLLATMPDGFKDDKCKSHESST